MNQPGKQIDLREYWSIIAKHNSLIIFPAIIVPLLAIVISFFMSPVYLSSVTILINDSKILPPTVEQQLEGLPQYNRITDAERQSSLYNQITSTGLLKRLITVLDISIDNDIKLTAAEAKKINPNVVEQELAETILTDKLRENINVSLHMGNLLEIEFKAPGPVEAQQRCSKLADIFFEESLANELAGVKQNIVFSEKQFGYFKDKLKEAENRLRDFRQSMILTDVETDTSGFDFQQIISAIDVLDFEISGKEARQYDLRNEIISSGIDIKEVVLSNEIGNEKDQLLYSLDNLVNLLVRYNWRDARVLNLNEETKNQLQILSNKINTYVNSKFNGQSAQVRANISEYLIGQLSIDFNRAKRAALDKSITRVRSRLSRNPDSQITLDRLQSEIEHYKNLSELFVTHSQYAVINQSAKQLEAEAKYTLVRPASLPLKPESPNKMKLLVMGLILGFAFGVGVIILLEIIDNSFKKVEEVENLLKLPVLGTIPRMRLPYSSTFRENISVFVGVFICVILVAAIIYLKFFKG